MFIKDKKQFFLLEGDEGGSFGGEGDPGVGGDGNPGEGGGTPAPAPAPVFDVKALASEFGNQLKGIFPQQQQQQRQYTPEEARKLLNVWEPDDAFLQEFGNVETQKGAFAKMRDAIFRQAFTAVQMHTNEVRQQIEAAFEEKYGKIVAGYGQDQERQQTERLHTAYPQLSDARLTPIVQGVAQQLIASGKRYTKEADLFADLAKGVESVIQVNNPDFKLTKSGSASGLPVTTPGSRGGGTGKATPPMAGKPKAVQLLS